MPARLCRNQSLRRIAVRSSLTVVALVTVLVTVLVASLMTARSTHHGRLTQWLLFFTSPSPISFFKLGTDRRHPIPTEETRTNNRSANAGCDSTPPSATLEEESGSGSGSGSGT